MPSFRNKKTVSTKNEVDRAQDVALGNEEKQVADKSGLELQAQVTSPVVEAVESTKPPVIVDTKNDDKEVSHKGSDAKQILAEYDKGAFNPEQIAEKFNVDPSVVVEIIDRRTQDKKED